MIKALLLPGCGLPAPRAPHAPRPGGGRLLPAGPEPRLAAEGGGCGLLARRGSTQPSASTAVPGERSSWARQGLVLTAVTGDILGGEDGRRVLGCGSSPLPALWGGKS